MTRKNKILLIVLSFIGIVSVVGVVLGYYLMNQFPVLGKAAGNNPIEALRLASSMMLHELTPSNVKSFNLTETYLNYSQTVNFPEDKLQLATVEQIIEWSVTHSNQPWVDDVGKFLSEANYSLTDTTAHFVFIECKSGNNPVMTITYYSYNKPLLVEKGWVERVTYNSYTLIVTEDIAIEIIKLNSDYQLVVKTIIENLNRNIRFEKE
jgi:hypothetical protein